MTETTRLVGTLTIVSAAAGLVLAVAAEVTREPIQRARQQAFEQALRSVLPEDAPSPIQRTHIPADGSPEFTYFVAGPAYAFETSSPSGYAGPIRLLTGFDDRDRLIGYKVLEHKETPGLGAHIADRFRGHVTGRKVRKTVWAVRQDNGDIDALTAATVSSRAACEAIASAVDRLNRVRAADAGERE